MPIYEYQCETCGRAEELLQNLGAPERHDCACGAPLGMARQLSVPALGGQQDGAVGVELGARLLAHPGHELRRIQRGLGAHPQLQAAPVQAPCPSGGGGCGGACPFSQ